MPLFGYSEQELARAREEGQRVEHERAFQTLLAILPRAIFLNILGKYEAPGTIERLAQTVACRFRDFQNERDRLQTDVDFYKRREKAWFDDPLQERLQRAQAEAQQEKHRADTAVSQVADLTKRLAAEQRARQADIDQRDNKIADLRRLLARHHLSLVEDSVDLNE
jgi:hypothetical protein